MRTSSLSINKLGRWVVVFGSRGIGGVAAVAGGIAAARLLGADQAGLVLLALSIVTILATFSRIGLDGAVVRHIGIYTARGDWPRVQGVFQLSMYWSMTTAVVIAVILAFTSEIIAEHFFQKPELAPVLRIMSSFVPAATGYWIISQCMIGLRRPEQASFIQNISAPSLFIFFLFLGHWLGVGLDRATFGALSFAVASFVTLIIALAVWGAIQTRTKATFEAKTLWASAKPLWIVSVMGQIVLLAGQIAAGVWLSASEVAYLVAAQRSVGTITLVLSVTNMFVSPRFASLHAAGNSRELQKLAISTARIMTAVSTVLSAILIVLAEQIMSVFGEGFGSAAIVLQVLVLGQWVNVATGSVGHLLIMTGNERDMRNITILSGAVAIALSIILTTSFGIIGAAWAVTLSLVIQNVAAALAVRHRLGFFPLS